MSFSSFYAGLTGLKSHAMALNVIGNNLANVNTVGYKGSRVSFSELFATAMGGFGLNGAGMPNQVGAGVQVAAVQQLFAQGAMQPSEVTTDLAIQGNGFFTLAMPDGQPAYTRAGNFSFNADGYLVDPNGFRVQGYTQRNADGSINASGAVTDIQIPTGMIAAPELTTYFQIDMNLDASAVSDNLATAGINEASNYTSSVAVYDSLGNPHNVSIYFEKAAATGQWTWEARIPKADLANPTATTTVEYEVVDSGTLQFDENGALSQVDGAAVGNLTLAIPPTGITYKNGAAQQSVEWRLLDATNTPVVTGYSSASAVNNLNQDGFAMGRLQALAVAADGTVSGVFSNGQTLGLAQLTIATFNAPDGLARRGENTYMQSIGSGTPALGAANSGGRGKISSRALELSNVDITDQFTDLIVTERGYQANSRVITTTDAIMQEALRLKQ